MITRSYHSSLIKQLCIIFVCSFPKLFLDKRFLDNGCKVWISVSKVLNCEFLRFFVVSLTWVVFVGLERKAHINS